MSFKKTHLLTITVALLVFASLVALNVSSRKNRIGWPLGVHFYSDTENLDADISVGEELICWPINVAIMFGVPVLIGLLIESQFYSAGGTGSQ